MSDSLSYQNLETRSLKELVAKYIIEQGIYVDLKAQVKIKMHYNIHAHRKLISRLSPNIRYSSARYKGIKLNSTLFKELGIYKNIALDSKQLLPTYIYIPGTAFIASEEGYTNFICSCIAQLTNCQIIVVKPKLAPEHNPIIILNQLYLFIKSLLSKKNSNLLQIDRNSLAIGGYSSGATLAILVATKALRDGIVFHHQILISPLTDLSRTISKHSQYKNLEDQDHLISEEFVTWFLDLYIADSISPVDPRISPYWVNNQKLRQSGATYITFGEFDRFRGDIEFYVDKLNSINAAVYKISFPKETHALLWKNHQVICSVAKQLKCLLEPSLIEKTLSAKSKSRVKHISKLNCY